MNVNQDGQPKRGFRRFSSTIDRISSLDGPFGPGSPRVLGVNKAHLTSIPRKHFVPKVRLIQILQKRTIFRLALEKLVTQINTKNRTDISRG